MSALNEEVLITLNELIQLETADISLCVSKDSALKICEKSMGSPGKIYNLWVQKLFKAYNLEDFTTKDWRGIIGYLRNVLQEVVKNLNASGDNELEQWLLDTQELLTFMETIVSCLDFLPLCLILIFVLEVIITTHKFANKKIFKILCTIQHLVVTFTNNFLYQKSIKDDNELENFNKIASSLCDVSSIIFSADIKTAIETWRSVAKLSEKLYSCNNSFQFTKSENAINMERQWNEKAILGIFKEVNTVIKCYNQNACSNTQNLLQIIQFYLKILRLLIHYTKETIKPFPALQIFIDLYTYCQHEIENNGNPKVELSINKPLYDIFSQIYNEDAMAEAVLQHLKYEADNFKSCKLVFHYLQIYIENCSKNRLNITRDLEGILKIYNGLVEGPLTFIDKDNYEQLLGNIAVLTILDLTSKLHMKLCQYVTDSSWIRGYTSMEILTIYYSYIFNTQKSDAHLKCLEFWVEIWNKLNKSNDTYRQRKRLVEILLKVLLNNTPDIKLHKAKFENVEIIFLKCGKESHQNIQYLETKLAEYLKKMRERCINGECYKELLNLTEICISRPHLINDVLTDNLLVTLIDMLSLPALEVQKFRDFVSNSLTFFYQKNDEKSTQKLVKYLLDHEQQCCNIPGVFLIKILLKHRPQSAKVLEALNTSSKITSTIISLFESTPANTQSPIDLQIFKDLTQTFQQSSNRNNVKHVNKKPRLEKGNFSNIKFILNDLNTKTRELVNFPCSEFDSNDLDILRNIKDTIEKILLN